MIILDTNVVSEPLRPRADPAVQAWLDAQAAETLYLTATNVAELLVGVEMLADGRRKRGLGSALESLIDGLFGSRVLPFDHGAARVYAKIVDRARRGGHSISVADGQIAAIAALHGFAVATRDVAPFAAAGLPVINPWTDER